MKNLHSIKVIYSDRLWAIALWFGANAKVYIDENGFACCKQNQDDFWVRMNHWGTKSWLIVLDKWIRKGKPKYPERISAPSGKIRNQHAL